MKRKIKQAQAFLLAAAILLMGGPTALAQEDTKAPASLLQAAKGEMAEEERLPGGQETPPDADTSADEAGPLPDAQRGQPARRAAAAYTNTGTSSAKIQLELVNVAIAPKEYDGEDRVKEKDISFILENQYGGEVGENELKRGQDYEVTGTYASADAGEDIEVTLTFSWLGTPSDIFEAPGDVTTTGIIKPASVMVEGNQQISLEYGQTLDEADLSGLKAKAAVSGKAVSGEFVWSAGCETGDRPGIDADPAAALFVDFRPDSANYEESTGLPVSLSLLPASPRPSGELSAEALQEGAPLSESTIRGGMVNPHLPSMEVAGSWSWKDGSVIPDRPQSFTAVFTPADSAHYQAAEAEIFVNIRGAQTLSLTADKTAAVYGDTVTCTASAEGAAAGEEIAFYLDDPDTQAISRSAAPTASLRLDKTRLTAGEHTVYAVYEEGTSEEERAVVRIHVDKKPLSWDVSGLAASKKAGEVGEASVSGRLDVTGILDGEVVFTPPASLKTSGFTAVSSGSYPVSVVPESGSWAFTPADPDNYLLPEGDPQITAEITDADEPLGKPLYKVEITWGITVVPRGLEDTAFNTPEKIIQELFRQLKEQQGYTFSEETVCDAVLMVSTDGGKSWSPASVEDFPKEGRVSVTIPYPQGTGQDTHDFIVSHMFTTDGFGKTPGTTEQPPVTNTAHGLQFTVTGLSPIGVGWKARETGADNSDGDGPDDGGDEEDGFWKRVMKRIEGKKPGDRLQVTAPETDPIPGGVLESLRRKKEVTLIICRDEEEVVIPSDQVPEGILRPFYSFSELKKIYQSLPAQQQSAAGKLNPGTGAYER